MSDEHPAMTAAKASWRCVGTRARDEWLDLLADDVVIEDPIGVGPTNPSGEGVRGKAEAAAFWDKNLAPTERIEFQVHESFAAGSESAHVLTLTTHLPGGTRLIVHGIFTYTVNPAGQIRALRGYWSMDQDRVVKAGSPGD